LGCKHIEAFPQLVTIQPRATNIGLQIFVT
jgi:hypothetical protein